MSTLKKDVEKQSKVTKKDDKQDQMKTLTGDLCNKDSMAVVLTERPNLQREHTEGSQEESCSVQH